MFQQSVQSAINKRMYHDIYNTMVILLQCIVHGRCVLVESLPAENADDLWSASWYILWRYTFSIMCDRKYADQCTEIYLGKLEAGLDTTSSRSRDVVRLLRICVPLQCCNVARIISLYKIIWYIIIILYIHTYIGWMLIIYIFSSKRSFLL